jgi:outer membrane lipopolysaccharide assembly protein LptE/RlpB
MRGEHGRDASHGEDSVSESRVASPESRVAAGGDLFLALGTRYSVLFVLLVSFLLVSPGCGYHTAGHAAQLPESVKTIAVPAFKNETLTYRIEQMLTASVVREFTTRTRYHIVSDPGEDADATLRGTVLSTTASPLAYDTATGRAASVLVVVSMRVSLTDRQGKVLYQNPAYLFREQYEVSQDLASFFEEDSPAFRRLSQDFARTLVANVLEGF